MFFCDPFGHTQPENLLNHGEDFVSEADYIFFHDQEPIQIAAHTALFDDVIRRNRDILPAAQGRIVTSEKGSEVQALCDIYGWKRSYYFFHGWACLDWYRGYDRTFLFPGPTHRSVPARTFVSPNRIIGGQRQHRVIFIYHCIKKKLAHNDISAPLICPHENLHMSDIAMHYNSTYPDIQQVLGCGNLPWVYPNEQTQKMASCWLDNFYLCTSNLVYVPTETVFFGDRCHITEKTFKAIALGMPFVLVAAAGSLEYLKHYGFRSFSAIWDESYDLECDDLKRLDMITDLLADLDQQTPREKAQIWRHCLDSVMHNWNHFYGGGFENILWHELTAMLEEMRV